MKNNFQLTVDKFREILGLQSHTTWAFDTSNHCTTSRNLRGFSVGKLNALNNNLWHLPVEVILWPSERRGNDGDKKKVY